MYPIAPPDSSAASMPAPTTEHAPDDEESSTPEAGQDGSGPIPPRDSEGETNSGSGSDDLSGGPRPGGPAPRSFFETISWCRPIFLFISCAICYSLQKRHDAIYIR